MKSQHFFFPVAVLFGSSLLGCSAIATQYSSSQNVEAVTVNPPTENREDIALSPVVVLGETVEQLPTASNRTATDAEKEQILAAIANQKNELGLCMDEDELPSESFDFSEVYVHQGGDYLAQVLCWNAAYQGVYEFVVTTPTFDNDTLEFRHTDVQLVGYPTVDLETNIIHNAYKFNGAGSCFEETSHYWNGSSLNLISAELVDGIEGGCDEMGVRSPSEDFLITADGVGTAKLGMTLAEFRATMLPDMTLEPTVLGVDMPEGLRLSWYGEVQYDLGFDSFPITESSKINVIAVRNPSFKTAQGIGAGTPLTMAIAKYGTATLSYSTENEMREAITFANGFFADAPDRMVWIRSNQWTVTDFAGIYPESDSSYKETQQYHDHAAIGAIWLMQ
ncbi:DUF1176 domain-containing protein [[Limnothrix rosea] IAM M-220]|uniref:DUF1176 domain-containing protein n=1 Tax=[Limnothrix rosea] IAM M-220 TaxID=454133 RepID=UPI00096A1C29|nr:DUF1176 domain-containing protein [[Limnothrix rosea] IAM M-220]OKH10803.1 hypothetical protein NIES208_18170 [[Limnothrix rosea] IAM M-220]